MWSQSRYDITFGPKAEALGPELRTSGDKPMIQSQPCGQQFKRSLFFGDGIKDDPKKSPLLPDLHLPQDAKYTSAGQALQNVQLHSVPGKTQNGELPVVKQ